MTSYEMKIIQKSDRTEVRNFLRNYFMKDEPINKSINLINLETPVNEPLEQFLLKDLENGICLKAEQNGNILGICLNSLIEKNQPECENIKKIDNDGFNKIVNFISYVQKHSKPFGTFPESQRAISVGVVAVHPSCRGKGIATQLLNKTWEIGKIHKCEFMTVESSSYYTAKALEKLDFELIYKLKFVDYRVDDQIVFKTEPPHTASSVHVKKIQ